MRKSVPATTFVGFPLSAKTTRLKTYGCIAIVLLAGCTNTQVRWDATKMREDVMVYYNDQIMDNLVKAKNNLPFVHVDITQLTSLGSSQISGTIGDGEARTNATSSMAGVIGTIARTVTRPFAYSVSPQRSETLTITAAPALGLQALASPTPSELPTPKPTPAPKLEITKETETIDKDKNISTTKEKTLKPAPQPTPITIYDLYRDFAAQHLQVDSKPPNKALVPGTVVKRWNKMYYYISNDDRISYYTFCTALFTKGQAGSLSKQLQAAQADVEAVKAILGTPVAPAAPPLR